MLASTCLYSLYAWLQLWAYRFSDNGGLLYFTRAISFFPSTDFLTSLNRRSMFWNLMGCSNGLPKNSRSENPNFCQFVDPNSTLWAPPFHNATEIDKSKTIGSMCGYARTFIQNTVSEGQSANTHGWDRLLPGVQRARLTSWALAHSLVIIIIFLFLIIFCPR